MRNVMEQRQRIVGSAGKYREEAIPAGILYVYDGQYRWAYNADRNEYTKMSTTAAGRAPALNMFELVGYRAKSARFLRQETLDLATGPVVCQVIEVERDPLGDRMRYSPMTYWIDATRNLALKLHYSLTITGVGTSTPAQNIITVSLAKATVGQPVQDSILRFNAPAGATQVERLTFGPKSLLVGNDAPDFELKGADGKPITGATLRGQVVLLQFAPSSDYDALFSLEMTYRSLQGKGLKAFHVLPPLNLPAGAGDLYTVPIATDPNGSVAKKFGMPYKGTVLIDRFGKVVYVDTTFRNSLDLVRALQKAGVW